MTQSKTTYKTQDYLMFQILRNQVFCVTLVKWF